MTYRQWTIIHRGLETFMNTIGDDITRRWDVDADGVLPTTSEIDDLVQLVNDIPHDDEPLC